MSDVSDNISSTVYLLKSENLSLTAEEKYFLIRLLWADESQDNLHAKFFNLTMRNLTAVTGIASNQLMKVCDSLLAKKYMDKCLGRDLVNNEKGGRPPIVYSLTNTLIDELKEADSKPSVDGDTSVRIEKLLGNEEYVVKKYKTKLSPANRVVLAVLYIHADECGFVENLSMKQLGKLAGLATRDRIEGQLDKLMKLGFILDYVPGLSGKIAWSVGGTSSFFLNVLDENLANDKKDKILFLSFVNYRCGYNAFWPSKRMMMMINKRNDEQKLAECLDDAELELFVNFKNKKPSWVNLELDLVLNKDIWMSRSIYINPISKVLQGLDKVWYADRFIQYKIAKYASWLLSGYWQQIDNKLIRIPAVLDKLNKDIFPEKINKGKFDDCVDEVKIFEMYLYRVIFETALLTKELIKQLSVDVLSDAQLSKGKYTILSKPYISNGRDIRHYAVIGKFNHQNDLPKAITVCQNNYEVTPAVLGFKQDMSIKEYKIYQSFDFINSVPWSSFNLNLMSYNEIEKDMADVRKLLKSLAIRGYS